MSVSTSFSDAVLELFAFVPEVRVRRMFGGAGVFAGEMMFALIDDDELFLKTDAQTRSVFDEAGSRPWSYSRGGQDTPNMGYLSAPESVWDDPDEARRWGGLALEAARRKFRPRKTPRKSQGG
jgi:DNA transformation protein and related proteins